MKRIFCFFVVGFNSKRMTLTSILGLLLLGFLAGILSSLVGIGGGIVIVPALVLIFGLTQHTAQGTTLAMLAMPVSLAAAYSYFQKGMVEWKLAVILGIGFVLGGFLGGQVAVTIPSLQIKRIFAILLLIIAAKFLFFDKK
ncbi:MAG: sulfite exporter TauE/SafE family protein [Chitinophagaceae bacterium]|nr:sulfite exporter TauE/SafE family protein [Chitinophagaceae bacterium]